MLSSPFYDVHVSSHSTSEPAAGAQNELHPHGGFGGLTARLRPELDQAIDQVLAEAVVHLCGHVEAFDRLNDSLELGGHVVGVETAPTLGAEPLRALGVGPEDEVVVPDFSFISTAEVVAEVGATPVFADIDPRTFQLDHRSAEQARTSKTKAVMVVHLFGQCSDMDALVPWAEEHGLHLSWRTTPKASVPSGAAHASKARRACSRTLWARRASSPSKNLGALGDGGAAMTRDADLGRTRVRRLTNHGAERKYHHLEVGFNSRLDGLQAALLEREACPLARGPWWPAARPPPARYDERLDDVSAHIPMLLAPATCHPHSTHTVPPILRVLLARRARIRNGLHSTAMTGVQGIPTAVYYPTPSVLTARRCRTTATTVEGGHAAERMTWRDAFWPCPCTPSPLDAMQGHVRLRNFSGLLPST